MLFRNPWVAVPLNKSPQPEVIRDCGIFALLTAPLDDRLWHGEFLHCQWFQRSLLLAGRDQP
jgi:hypothetical protein